MLILPTSSISGFVNLWDDFGAAFLECFAGYPPSPRRNLGQAMAQSRSAQQRDVPPNSQLDPTKAYQLDCCHFANLKQ